MPRAAIERMAYDERRGNIPVRRMFLPLKPLAAARRLSSRRKNRTTPRHDLLSEAPPSRLRHIALRGELRARRGLHQQQRMRGALRRIAAVQGLQLPEPAEPGRAAFGQRLADLVALHRRRQGGHRAGRPDPGAHAGHRRPGGARSQGQPCGAARPFVAPAQAAGQVLADRPRVQRARVAVHLRRSQALPQAAAHARAVATDRRPDPLARPLRPPRRGHHRVPRAARAALLCRWACARGWWPWACPRSA